tara:strand:+ start:243 stop:356 length:114 start_codon:yes stop_codon:yes gene_type:complete
MIKTKELVLDFTIQWLIQEQWIAWIMLQEIMDQDENE